VSFTSKPKPEEASEISAIKHCEDSWLSCTGCGRKLVHVRRAQCALLDFKCPGCGKAILFILGVDIDASSLTE